VTRFAIDPHRSVLSAVARSSVYPILGEGRHLTGWVDAVVTDGVVDTLQPASAAFELDTLALQADNPLVNREIQRRLGSRRYPTIKAQIDEVTDSAPGRYGIRGKLTLHGITQEVAGGATAQVDGADVITVDGELTIDMREFGLDPPTILGLRVYPEVAVRLRVVAVPEQTGLGVGLAGPDDARQADDSSPPRVAGDDAIGLLRTPRGLQIRLNDAADHVLLTTRAGRRIEVSGDGGVVVDDGEGDTITADNGRIVIAAAGTVEVRAAQVEVTAEVTKFSGIVQCETLLATSIVAVEQHLALSPTDHGGDPAGSGT